MRLLAALVVVYIHWQAIFFGLPLRYPTFLDPVPVFVCLSGILIPTSFAGSADWKHFARKRILRVYPAFIASLILVWYLFGPQEIWLCLVAYATFGIAEVSSVNGVLWSLLLEEHLYTFHLFSRLRKMWNPWTATACMVGCIFLWNIYHAGQFNNILRASAAFFAGNVVFFNIRWLKRIPGWVLLGIYILARILEAEQMLKIPTPVAVITFATAGSAILVLGFRNISQIQFKFPDLSYGSYLYHMPILFFLTRMIIWRQPLGCLALLIALTLLAACISWFAIEKPALGLKNRSLVVNEQIAINLQRFFTLKGGEPKKAA